MFRFSRFKIKFLVSSRDLIIARQNATLSWLRANQDFNPQAAQTLPLDNVTNITQHQVRVSFKLFIVLSDTPEMGLIFSLHFFGPKFFLRVINFKKITIFFP